MLPIRHRLERSRTSPLGRAPNPWISISDALLAIVGVLLILGILEKLGQKLLRPGFTAIENGQYRDLLKRRQLAPDEEIAAKDRVLPEGQVGIDKDRLDSLLRLRPLAPGEEIAPVDRILREGQVAIDRTELDRLRKIKPLIMDLSEMKKFVFDSGKADLSPEFRRKIDMAVMPIVESIVAENGIEVIEVIGHTDGEPIEAGVSNLDSKMLGLRFPYMGTTSLVNMRPGSNSDLGLMRALSVADYICNKTKVSTKKELSSLEFRVYSAAFLIDPQTQFIKAPDKSTREDLRRRVELRFTRRSLSLDNGH